MSTDGRCQHNYLDALCQSNNANCLDSRKNLPGLLRSEDPEHEIRDVISNGAYLAVLQVTGLVADEVGIRGFETQMTSLIQS